MTNQTQKCLNRQASENAFIYNILVPDLALFVIGITTGFGALLTVFS